MTNIPIPNVKKRKTKGRKPKNENDYVRCGICRRTWQAPSFEI